MSSGKSGLRSGVENAECLSSTTGSWKEHHMPRFVQGLHLGCSSSHYHINLSKISISVVERERSDSA